MNIWQIGGIMVGLVLILIAWACCAVGGKTDEWEDWMLAWIYGKPIGGEPC
jgi:hypothetical protein